MRIAPGTEHRRDRAVRGHRAHGGSHVCPRSSGVDRPGNGLSRGRMYGRDGSTFGADAAPHGSTSLAGPRPSSMRSLKHGLRDPAARTGLSPRLCGGWFLLMIPPMPGTEPPHGAASGGIGPGSDPVTTADWARQPESKDPQRIVRSLRFPQRPSGEVDQFLDDGQIRVMYFRNSPFPDTESRPQCC